MTDINEQVAAEWKEETTSRERIKDILEQTTEYQTVSEIADRALTSEPTTRKYLDELVEEGRGVTTQDGRTTKYKRDEGALVDERIAELRRTTTQQEIIQGIQEMKEEIHKYRDTYDVDSPEGLALELEAGESGWVDVGRWRSTKQNLAIAKAALQVDEAHRTVEA